MPLIPLAIDDKLYDQLLDDASLEGVSVLNYIYTRIAQPKAETLEIYGEPGEGVVIQPAVALDEEYQCGFTLAHLKDARQILLEVATFLGYPLGEVSPPRLPACREAQWQAQRILASLTWLSKSLETDAYQVVDASRVEAKADPADGFDPFWMVVRDLGDGHAVSATKRHPAMVLAEQEAERLCSKERKPFLIFQAVARCDAGPTPINWQLSKDHRL